MFPPWAGEGVAAHRGSAGSIGPSGWDDASAVRRPWANDKMTKPRLAETNRGNVERARGVPGDEHQERGEAPWLSR